MSAPAANIHLRSSLVLQEPLNVRSPIYGQFHGLPPPDPRCSLADALAPLLQAIQSGQVVDLSLRELQAAITFCHNNGTDIKQIRDKDKPCKLTVAGIAAISLFLRVCIPKGAPAILLRFEQHPPRRQPRQVHALRALHLAAHARAARLPALPQKGG